MAITDFPVSLQPLMQEGYLERAFEQGLTATRGFDDIAEKMQFPNQVGETFTRTKWGKMQAKTTPLNPNNDTNLDNGMTPSTYANTEQYTITMAEYADTLNLNTMQEETLIQRLFLQNAMGLGESALRSRETIARNKIWSAYSGGNTWVNATLGSAGNVVAIDDVNGFQSVYVSNGNGGTAGPPVAVGSVSGANLLVTIGAGAYTVQAVTVDSVNISKRALCGGVSGTLQLTSNVSVSDATAGNAVTSAIAPVVLRPNNRATSLALVPGDTVSMVKQIIRASSIMRDNGVPDAGGGYYNAYLSNTALSGLFEDPNFLMLFRGTGMEAREIRSGLVFEVAGIRFVPNQMAAPYNLTGYGSGAQAVTVNNILVAGAGAMIRATFAGQDHTDVGDGMVERTYVDEIAMITRKPMDRLGRQIAQSYHWVGSYTVPTDVTANATTIPTATNSAFKRGIMIECTSQ